VGEISVILQVRSKFCIKVKDILNDL